MIAELSELVLKHQVPCSTVDDTDHSLSPKYPDNGEILCSLVASAAWFS